MQHFYTLMFDLDGYIALTTNFGKYLWFSLFIHVKIQFGDIINPLTYKYNVYLIYWCLKLYFDIVKYIYWINFLKPWKYQIFSLVLLLLTSK